MRSTAEAKRCACVCVSVGALHMYSMNQYLTAAIQLKIAHILSNTDREINYAFFSVMPLLLAGDGGAFCIFPVGNIFNIFADTICTRMPDCDTQFCVFFVGGFRRCIVYSNVLTWF